MVRAAIEMAFTVAWHSSKPSPHGGPYSWAWSGLTERDVRRMVPRGLERWPDATASVEREERDA